MIKVPIKKVEKMKSSDSLIEERRTTQKSRTTIARKHLQKRDSLWPDLDEERIWRGDDKHPGYTLIPRTMPIILGIMDGLSKNLPVSRVYFDLWCRCYEDFSIVITNSKEHAIFSGFSGQRPVHTWEKRMRLLANLHFIDIKPGPNGDISYVIIWNPYLVIKEHCQKKTPGMRDDLYNSLVARATDIGAVDLSKKVLRREEKPNG